MGLKTTISKPEGSLGQVAPSQPSKEATLSGPVVQATVYDPLLVWQAWESITLLLLLLLLTGMPLGFLLHSSSICAFSEPAAWPIYFITWFLRHLGPTSMDETIPKFSSSIHIS